MKKSIFITLLIIIIMVSVAFGEDTTYSEDWYTSPVITQAYEISSGKLYLEWEGSAPVYQVYIDGKSVADSIINNAVVDIKEGTHTIHVYPINESKSADTQLELGLNVSIISANIDLDLASLGIDPQNLVAGKPSEALYIDYSENSIYEACPEDLYATTDFDDRVHLSFTDRHYSDEYIVTIKVGKDESSIKYICDAEITNELIIKNKASVTLILDPEYLESQECLIPELGEKYTFTVQLRKYAANIVDGESITTVVHASEESDKYKYTPTAAWKTAPTITYASQTADGQITLEWTHDDNGLGCEYAIMAPKKTLGVTTGEKEIAVVTDHQYIIDDLMNDEYTYTIVPKFNGETGEASAEAEIEVKNDWVAAPSISCSQINENSVLVTWTAVEGVETYKITVFTGDNDSLLRFVDLDYSEYGKYEVVAAEGEMEFVFEYDEEIDPENGEKVKFEIYGVHLTSDGSEQQTATTTKSIKIYSSQN